MSKPETTKEAKAQIAAAREKSRLTVRSLLLNHLVMMKALQFQKPGEPGFKLRSGRVSDYYVDLRPAMLKSRTVSYFVHLMMAELNNILPEAPATKERLFVAGMGVAGRTLVGATLGIAGLVNMNFNGLYLRDEVKAHGTGKDWEGPEPHPGDRIILLDDVLTSGTTAIELKQRLVRTFNIEPLALIVCCDREEGGREALAEHNIKVHSIFTPADLRKYKEEMDEAQQSKQTAGDDASVAAGQAQAANVPAVPPGQN